MSLPHPISARVRFYSELRPKKSRTKTGCFTCRHRRKKCDEQKLGSSLHPTCASCLRNGLACSWPPQRIGDALQMQLARVQSSSLAISTTSSSATSCLRVSSELCKPNRRLDPVVNSPFWPTLEGGILQSPGARLLLEYYTLKTSHVLAGRKAAENPFLTCVLPRALSDELILSCILSMSAAHRAHYAAYADADSLSSRYYVMTLHMLKDELDAKLNGERSNMLHLLLAVILLATTEGVGGNTNGAVYYHLSTSKSILSSLIISTTSSVDQDLRSFLIESYAYLVLISNITFNSDCASYGLLNDPLLSSLEQHRPRGTYGSMMGCAHGLFELIPGVCQLAHKRLHEILHDITPIESLAQYSQLEQTIRTWTIPADLAFDGDWFRQLSTTAHIYKHALLMFLHTAFHCLPTADDEFISWLQPEIDTALSLAQQLTTDQDPSPLANTLLWPTVIVGSCLSHREQRQFLRAKLKNQNLAITDQATLLLDHLWTENTENGQPLFGPIGLQVVMDKHQINICMA